MSNPRPPPTGGILGNLTNLPRSGPLPEHVRRDLQEVVSKRAVTIPLEDYNGIVIRIGLIEKCIQEFVNRLDDIDRRVESLDRRIHNLEINLRVICTLVTDINTRSERLRYNIGNAINDPGLNPAMPLTEASIIDSPR